MNKFVVSITFFYSLTCPYNLFYDVFMKVSSEYGIRRGGIKNSKVI